jgi:hypothetical protein
MLNFLLDLFIFLWIATSIIMGFASIIDTSTTRFRLDGAMEQWLHMITFYVIGALLWWYIIPYKKYVRDTNESET